MNLARTLVSVVGAAALVLVTAACDDDGGGGEVPGELRIDGPAQVDPEFDPFATVPPTTGG